MKKVTRQTKWRRTRETLEEMVNNNVANVTHANAHQPIASVSSEHPVPDESIEINESESELSDDENERCETEGIHVVLYINLKKNKMKMKIIQIK